MQQFRVGSFLFTMLGSLTLALSASANSSSTLTIDVDGLRNREGQVCLSVFAASVGFPTKTANAVQSQCIKITDAPFKVTLRQLQPGSYAVAVLHDENNDRQANNNFLGIPEEGFGFSRNPAISFGPPKFADSVVPLTGSSTNIKIQLKYLAQ